MQNKHDSSHGLKHGIHKGCLMLALLTSPAFAQLPGSEQPAANPAPAATPVIRHTDSESTSQPESGINTKDKLNPASKRPPVIQFTPTEKIHAGDAVSFPVDI